MSYSLEQQLGYSLFEINSFQIFLDNAGDVYWVFNEERIISHSENFSSIFDTKNFSHELDLFKDIVVKEELETLELWREKIRKNEAFKSDIKLILPDNKEAWFHIVSIPMNNKGGEVKLRAGYMKNISEQKIKEEKLFEMVERYEKFFSHTSEAIFRIEMETPIDVTLPIEEQVKKVFSSAYIAECNASYANLAGHENIYELLGKKLSDFLPSNIYSKQRIERLAEQNWELKNQFMVEKDKDGNDIFLTGNFIGVIKAGQLIRCWGSILDISKQIRAERKAQIISEAFEQIQVSIVIINPDGKIEYVNPKFESVCGYTYEEVQGKSFENFKLSKEECEICEDVKGRMSEGKQWNGTLCSEKKNGELLWESVIISPVKNDSGAVTNFIAIAEDITSSVKVQEELERYRESLEGFVDQRTQEIKEQYNFLISLIESLPLPVYVLSEGGKYKIVNRSFEDFSMLKKENIIGKSVNQVGPFFLSDEGRIKRKKIIKRENTDIFEVKIGYGGSLIKNVIVYQTELKFEGAAGEILGVIHDITERKNLELQTRHALQRERELNQMKTNFISMVSHEFRTPLTAILTTAEFIERYYDRINKEKLISQIKNIYFSVEKMTSLLEDIIFLSKNESGKLEFKPEKINLNEVIEKTINDVSNLLVSGQAIMFKNDLSTDSYFLDKKLLYIILTNLLTNAIKYSPKDKKINLTVLECGRNIKLIIEDEGIGIKPSDHNKIFEPFYRTDEVSAIPGSGLGLSVVKEAVEAHKGSITFRSILQKGTKFEVLIPLTLQKSTVN